MQDASGKLPEITLEAPTSEEIESPNERVRFYTRILVSLCILMWFASFLAFMGSEWLHTRQIPRYVKVVPRPPRTITVPLRVSATLSTLIAVGGWWGALHHRHGILCWFSWISFGTSVVDISCGVVTLTYTGKTSLLMQNDVQRDLNSVTDPKASFLTDKFLELQKKIRCCGVNSYQDWINSSWWKAQREVNSSFVVPESCCIQGSVENQCNEGNPPYTETKYPQLLHQTGCMQRITDYMNDLFCITGSLALIGGIIKFFGFYGLHIFINKMLKYEHQQQEEQIS